MIWYFPCKTKFMANLRWSLIFNTFLGSLSWIYKNKKSYFENLLDKDKSVSTHHKNLRSLAIEMYKVHCGISPEVLNDLFPLRQADQYNLRNRSQFILTNVKTVKHCFESLRYLGPKLWETIPSHLKEIDSLKTLKMPSKNGN